MTVDRSGGRRMKNVEQKTMFAVAPALLTEGPQLGLWQVAVVRVNETPAGDSSEQEPLALLVLDHADPAGQHAAIQNTTSLLEHLPAQPEPSLGGGLVERISDGEPTVRQVSGTALDSQLMEGTTYLEHPALGVSLDSRPVEGSSYLEPVEQSILQSSWTASPRNCAEIRVEAGENSGD